VLLQPKLKLISELDDEIELFSQPCSKPHVELNLQ
jgi:hypothetical protein